MAAAGLMGAATAGCASHVSPSAGAHTERAVVAVFEDLGAASVWWDDGATREGGAPDLSPAVALPHDARVLADRLHSLGDGRASVVVQAGALVVRGGGRLPVAPSALAVPGLLSFRPVTCLAPAASAGAVGFPASAMSCAARYRLDASTSPPPGSSSSPASSAGSVSSPASSAGPVPDPALAGVATTAPANDFPAKAAVLPAPASAHLPGQRLLLAPSAVPVDAVRSASAVRATSGWALEVRFTAPAAAQWRKASPTPYLAVDLDGVVLAVPHGERGRLPQAVRAGTVEISGDFTRARARYLGAILASGALTSDLRLRGAPAPPTPVTVPSDVQPEGVAFWDAESGLLVATLTTPACLGGLTTCPGGLIERTTDGGRTWAVVDRVDVPLDAVAVSGSDVAWVTTGRCGASSPDACGSSQLLVTTDGGQSWQPVTAGTAVTSVSPLSATTAWAVAAAQGAVPPGSRLLETTDGGPTWQQQADPCAAFAGVSLWAVDFATASAGWAVCTTQPETDVQGKDVVVTVDGGSRWLPAATACPDIAGGQGSASVGTLSCQGYLPGIDVLADGYGWMWTARGGLEATTDGGTAWTWIAQTTVTDDANQVLSASVVGDGTGLLLIGAPETPAGCPAAGCGPQLLTTTDGGVAWTTVESWSPT